MDTRHSEYIEYYRARLKKYEGNALYKNTYASEKALFDAISTAPTLEEFREREKSGNLSLNNAKAQIKDQQTYRADVFMELREPIRARGPQKMLKEVDSFSDVTKLVTRSNEILQENSKEIAVDLLTGNFYSDFDALENIEIWQTAQVPDRWKDHMSELANDQIESTKKIWKDVRLPAAHKWDSQWKLNYDAVREPRHRRLIPVPDAMLTRRIELHKKYFS